MKHEISHQGNNTPDYTKENSLLGEFTHDRSCKKNVFFSVNIRTKKQMRIPSDTVLKVRPSNIAVTAFFHGLDVQVVPTHQIFMILYSQSSFCCSATRFFIYRWL